MKSSAKKKVHFIGAGGIGVSALAKYHLANGAEVTGSDLVSSEISEDLSARGAKIKIGKHSAKNVPMGISAVVYTAAVAKNNPELVSAKKRRIKTMSYAEAVGELTKNYKTITVSGSHGKSTTTAMASHVLEEGYLDPTIIVGTKLKAFGNSNFRSGRGTYLLLEADEWNKSFLNYHPDIAVVTNIDAEHLDTYKTAEEAEKVFAKYLSRVPKNGIIIANRDNERLRRVAEKFGKRVRWYSVHSPEASIVRKILKVPGEHNVSNALAVLALGRVLGIHEPAILKGLASFRGSWRRFEFKGSLNGAVVYDDYGHHPREIAATILAARSRFPLRRIWCVFQPHQYQRLSYLWDDFVGAFDMADRICLLPVYDVAGRETKSAREKVNSVKLTQALLGRGKNACHLASFDKAKKFISKNVRKGDVVLMMGAGDIYDLSKDLLRYGN